MDFLRVHTHTHTSFLLQKKVLMRFLHRLSHTLRSPSRSLFLQQSSSFLEIHIYFIHRKPGSRKVVETLYIVCQIIFSSPVCVSEAAAAAFVFISTMWLSSVFKNRVKRRAAQCCQVSSQKNRRASNSCFSWPKKFANGRNYIVGKRRWSVVE